MKATLDAFLEEIFDCQNLENGKVNLDNIVKKQISQGNQSADTGNPKAENEVNQPELYKVDESSQSVQTTGQGKTQFQMFSTAVNTNIKIDISGLTKSQSPDIQQPGKLLIYFRYL